MAFRIDLGELQPPRRREDGTMVVDALITRSGVFNYANPDGSIRREYRPPDEVAKMDSLETFKMIPVTNDHPPEMVNADNAKKYTVGVTGQDLKMDGDFVRAPLAIFDAETIRDIEAGKREVSCGYHVDVEPTPGVAPSGEHYDAIQRNIRGNHVAVVDRGRAGPNVRIRMDAAIMVNLPRIGDNGPSTPENPTERNDLMELTKEQFDALHFEKAKETLRADQAEAEITPLKSQVEVLTAERDDARDKLEQAEKARQDAEAAHADAVKASVALRLKALTILPESDKGPDRFDGMSDKDVKLAVIEHLSGKRIDADKSDEYISARFDAATEGDIKPTEKTPDAPKMDKIVDNSEAAFKARQRAALQALNPYYANKQ